MNCITFRIAFRWCYDSLKCIVMMIHLSQSDDESFCINNLTSLIFWAFNLMNISFLRSVTLSDAHFLTALFCTLSLTVFDNIQVSYSHSEEIECCNCLWCCLDSVIWYLIYTTLKSHIYCTINCHYSSLSSEPDSNLEELWLCEQFHHSSYITFDYSDIILHFSNLLLKLQ